MPLIKKKKFLTILLNQFYTMHILFYIKINILFLKPVIFIRTLREKNYTHKSIFLFITL